MKILPKKLLLVYQICGTFPATYKSSNFGKETLEFSQITYYWNLAVLIFQTSMTYFVLIYNSELGFSAMGKLADNFFDVIGINLEAICQNAFTILLFIHTSKNWRVLKHIYCSLENCEKLLQQSLFTKSLSWSVPALLIHVKVLITTSFFLDNNHYPVGYSYPYLSQYFSFLSYIIQFRHISQSISLGFEKINMEIIGEIIRTGQQSLLEEDDGFFKTEGIVRVRGLVAPPIDELLQIYWRLCDIVHKSNSFYGSLHLAITSLMFFHIVATVYHMFLISWPTFDAGIYGNDACLTMWFISFFFYLGLISSASSDVTSKATDTGPLICKLINIEENKERVEQLIHFLPQLTFKNTELSALGFFKVYNHILTSILASVTTYWVILIQFRISRD